MWTGFNWFGAESVLRSYEHGNTPSGGTSIYQLSDYQLFKDYAPWI
jgi:hypothetical protein